MSPRSASDKTSAPSPAYRLGIDIGGTFTDFVVVGPDGLRVHKTPSTPADPCQAILRGLSEIFGPQPPPLEIVHGTTVGTNAFLERRGAAVALLTTAGFEDVIFIGRQTRPQLYALTGKKPPPLLPREHCLGVRERLRADGSILLPLDAAELVRLRQRLQNFDVAAVAVCLLHAYRNPVHEQMLAASLADLGWPVSLSSQVLPEIREFERTSTTLINAYLGPVVGRYLAALQPQLPPGALYIQQSNGGFLPAAAAATLAVHTILSGPAGGVRAAWSLGPEVGASRFLTFDMGGTSTDVALIDGAIPFTTEYSLDGFPIGIGVIDIHTVGAGGGSMAWQDRGGALRVGPRSAGAVPGPVCYGHGGEAVTVTDANLCLGRLRPEGFLGGRMTLDAGAAFRALSRLAADFDVSPVDLALGIVRVANSAMAKALRAVSLERGYDPRQFTLVCFGGAAGLHVCEVAREMGLGRIIIPARTGVFSALGMAGARPRRDFSRTILLAAHQLAWEALSRELEALTRSSLDELAREGLAAGLELSASLEVRYVGQSYTLNIPWGPDFAEVFHGRHRQAYGHAQPGRPLEVTTLRLHCQGPDRGPVPSLVSSGASIHLPSPAQAPVWLGAAPTPIPVWPRPALAPGAAFQGPALIVEEMATVLVLPEFHGRLDQYGHLHLRLRES